LGGRVPGHGTLWLRMGQDPAVVRPRQHLFIRENSLTAHTRVNCLNAHVPPTSHMHTYPLAGCRKTVRGERQHGRGRRSNRRSRASVLSCSLFPLHRSFALSSSVTGIVYILSRESSDASSYLQPSMFQTNIVLLYFLTCRIAFAHPCPVP